MSIKQEAIWPPSPTTTRGAPTPLSSSPSGTHITYASQKSIFVRSIDHPHQSKQYTAHTAPTTVARFSPSGYYIASGDVSGSVRVWDSVGAETTKGEYHIIAGRINDIAWDGDSQRIIAVGDGKERFGHCITADSGNSVGEISGHSSQINCVSIRQQRPLRAATGSDDTSLCFFHGAPFKFNTSVRGKHDKFIYATQFSPDGAQLVSVGSDRRIWLYDGKTGEPVKQVGEGEHKGSIFGVSWAPDSRFFATCSGDQTVRIWDSESGACVRSWRMGPAQGTSIADQQVGITWPAGRSDGLVISVDLEGNLNYFYKDQAEGPVRVVRGHQKAITAAALLPASSSSDGKATLWTGSSEGRARCWDLATGSASLVSGEGHSNYISGIATSPSTPAHIHTTAWDDTLRTIDPSSSPPTFTPPATKTAGQPKNLAIALVAGEAITCVATASGVTFYTASGTETGAQKLPSPPTCIAASGDTVAVGCEDKRVRLFSAAACPQAFHSMTALAEPTSPASALAFSPDGAKLAVGLANGKIFVYAIHHASASPSSSSQWTLETSRWSAHTARISSLAWSPEGRNVVSGSLDTNVMVWSVADPGKRVRAMGAHKEGVGAVVWTGEQGRVVSAGADGAVKVWRVEGLV
ncbi:hypothetical protein LTR08_000850 [Meristemomyces frigidus]|nr:hypothetical protein LTR08_000850 [Meristemomyces frigidus]